MLGRNRHAMPMYVLMVLLIFGGVYVEVAEHRAQKKFRADAYEFRERVYDAIHRCSCEKTHND